MSDWRLQALCAQTNPESWFPEISATRLAADAKKICAQCDVRVQCLDWALANDMRHGIWGGLTERERARLKNATGTTEPKVCGLDDCDEVIPPGCPANQKYCKRRHADLASERRRAAA